MLFITLVIAALPDNDNTNGVRSRRCVEGAKPQPDPYFLTPSTVVIFKHVYQLCLYQMIEECSELN